MFGTFSSIITAIGVWFGVHNGNALWAGFITLILFWFAGFTATLYFLKPIKEEKGMGWSGILYELIFQNVISLKDGMSSVVGHIPTLWAVVVKHLITPDFVRLLCELGCVSRHAQGRCCLKFSLITTVESLVIWLYLTRNPKPVPIFCLLPSNPSATTETDESQFGHYGGFVVIPYQMLGIILIAFVALVIIVGSATPQVCVCLVVPQIEDYMDKVSVRRERPHCAEQFNDDQDVDRHTSDEESA
mmetsp:Transcript_17715/g.51569  ORF Transcript_17715/g.51569 Transcript_17715/m.51569 type:complete len:245 (-) Transcript_17715:470-1204(-)